MGVRRSSSVDPFHTYFSNAIHNSKGSCIVCFAYCLHHCAKSTNEERWYQCTQCSTDQLMKSRKIWFTVVTESIQLKNRQHVQLGMLPTYICICIYVCVYVCVGSVQCACASNRTYHTFANELVCHFYVRSWTRWVQIINVALAKCVSY